VAALDESGFEAFDRDRRAAALDDADLPAS
jgi:hypothetical protein